LEPAIRAGFFVTSQWLFFKPGDERFQNDGGDPFTIFHQKEKDTPFQSFLSVLKAISAAQVMNLLETKTSDNRISRTGLVHMKGDAL